jgi:hypothetical protein
MSEVPERTVQTYDFDMDRVIIDPDYRRRVIARLQRERSREALPSAGEGEAAARR